MHPPLIYCPKSTQFQFRIGDENQCFLHPHHGPLPHLGDDSNDTVTSIKPSSPDPAVKTASQLPLTGDNATINVGEVREASSVGHVQRRTSFQASNMKKKVHPPLDERPDKQGGYHGVGHACEPIATSTLPNVSSKQPGRPALNQKIVSPTYDHPQNRAANSSNRRGKGNKERKFGTNNKATRDTKSQSKSVSSSGNEYPANMNRAPSGVRHQAHSDPPYQYPHQAATIPHFQGASGRIPPIYDYYTTVYNGNQQYQYQVSAPPTTSPLVSNPAFPERISGNGTRGVTASRNGHRASSFNPQAAAFEVKARENSVSVDEQRQQHLEQLRQSNDAAYNCSNHGKSRSVSGTSDDDGNREVRTSKSHSPPASELSEKNAHHASQTGDDVHSKPRSLSESYPRLPSISRASSPVTQEVHSPKTNKGKGKMLVSSASRADAPLLASTVQSTAMSAGSSDDNRNTGKETDTRLPHGQETDQRPKFLWSDDVEDALEASRNPIKMDPLSLQSLTTADEAVKSESSHADNASVQTECDVSIKQESDDEDSNCQGTSESAFSSAKTDTKVEVKDGSHSEVGTPRVPPNSPVHCADEIHKRADTYEREDPSTTRDDAGLPKSPKDSNSQALAKAPKTHISDAPSTAEVPAQSSGPNTGVSVQKSWSAVVSGRYVPSEASHPRPSQAATPTPSTRTAVPVNIPESKTVKPATPLNKKPDSSTTATTAANKQHSGVSNAPSRKEAPTKTWASLLHGASDAPGSKKPQQSTGPETNVSKRCEGESPLSNPSSNPASPPAQRAYPQEMLNSIWERKFPNGSRLGPDAAASAASSTTPKGPDSASMVSDDSIAATEATISSTRSAQSATPTRPGRPGQIAPQKPRLWSQVIGAASNRLVSAKSRSESSNGDTQWPSLGTRGPALSERKRNSSS